MKWKIIIEREVESLKIILFIKNNKISPLINNSIKIKIRKNQIE